MRNLGIPQFFTLILDPEPWNVGIKKESYSSNSLIVWVIRLGLEPKTPTLKVLCSTCWASESNLFFFLSKVLIKSLESLQGFAVWTGLEPATPCVTGRYSNQLNYHTIVWMLSFPIASAKVRIIFESASVLRKKSRKSFYFIRKWTFLILIKEA